MRWKFSSFLAVFILFLTLASACSMNRDDNGGQIMENTKGKAMETRPPGFDLGILLFDPEIEKNVYLEGKNMKGLKHSEVLDRVRKAAKKIDIKPENAVLDPKKWVVVKKEKPGKKVNAEKTLEKLLNSNEGANNKLVVEKVEPQVTAEKLKKNIVEIGSYSTPLLDRQWRRMTNIRLASKKINYTILSPGDEFSFNRIVGPRTKAKGYQDAPVIIKTPKGVKKKDEIGGGICQLSSTIYNAVEQCGMEVTERHLHSRDVPYVPEGRDATVAFENVDFKFRNNRDHPVMIRIYIGKKDLTVKLIENRN